MEIAKTHNIPTQLINRQMFYESEDLLGILRQYHVDFVVLAGFLWLIPAWLVRAYQRRTVNIHPALLPKYGGKGMYGMHVHEAVRAANGSETGITIHYVLQRIPIVILTTSKAEEDIVRTYDLGVNSFICKPVTFDSLVVIVKTVGRYWIEIVALPPECQRAVA